MTRSKSRVPAKVLLAKLGWHHESIPCRDGEGRRAAMHVGRRTHDVVEVELPEGERVHLSNLEVGRLRAALRDVLVDRHPEDRSGAA